MVGDPSYALGMLRWSSVGLVEVITGVVVVVVGERVGKGRDSLFGLL